MVICETEKQVEDKTDNKSNPVYLDCFKEMRFLVQFSLLF